eukprot:6385065-Prymnesium_polylepis.1
MRVWRFTRRLLTCTDAGHVALAQLKLQRRHRVQAEEPRRRLEDLGLVALHVRLEQAQVALHHVVEPHRRRADRVRSRLGRVALEQARTAHHAGHTEESARPAVRARRRWLTRVRRPVCTSPHALGRSPRVAA